jgi:hypothetical protein
MVDVKLNRIYFECVPDRTAKTLLSIIYDHVFPKTIINSDCYSSYNKINRLHEETVEHKTVNHTYNFVDPESSTHTNKIESLWNVGKIKFKDMRGCNRLYIQSYLDEFMWRHNNKVSRHDAFNKILEDLVVVYKISSKHVENLIDGLDIDIGEECDASSDRCSEISNDDEFPCDFFEFFPTNDIDFTNKEVDLTNKEVDFTNKEVDFTNKEVDLTNKEVDLTTEEDFEILSIEHQSIKELKFVVLASN